VIQKSSVDKLDFFSLSQSIEELCLLTCSLDDPEFDSGKRATKSNEAISIFADNFDRLFKPPCNSGYNDYRNPYLWEKLQVNRSLRGGAPRLQLSPIPRGHL